jgi:hypothetical protein
MGVRRLLTIKLQRFGHAWKKEKDMRLGAFNVENLPEIKSAKDAASDHAALWVELDI